ncbi:hypothetical protein D3C78_1683060 [compost metagenome]
MLNIRWCASTLAICPRSIQRSMHSMLCRACSLSCSTWLGERCGAPCMISLANTFEACGRSREMRIFERM